MHPSTSPSEAGISGTHTAARASQGTLRFGDCELHMPTRELWRAGERQPVRKRVFELIAYLIACRPSMVRHADIARAVWGRLDVRSTVIAQAILQARRATGDDLKQPVFFVSVRGVGYRFGGAIREAVAEPALANAEPQQADLQAAVEEAQAAARRGDSGAAMYLAERAIALADRAGAHLLKARALSIAAWAALLRGSMALAARCAQQALQLAELEDHRAIAAAARVRVASVLFAAGDLQGALQMLEAIRPADLPDPADETLLELQTLAYRIYGDLQQFDQALDWCRRAEATAGRMEPPMRPLRHRLGLVNIHLKQAEAAQALHQQALARGHFADALLHSEAMAADLEAIGTATERIAWHGNQGLALAGLGRLEEAWRHTRQARALLEAWPDHDSPWYRHHQDELRLQWATLLGQESRTAEALEEIELGIAGAESAGRHDQVSRFAALASGVCEFAGRFEPALRWLQRAQAAQARLRKERAELLAVAYQARCDNEGVVRELAATRARLVESQARVQQLSDRLLAFERASVAEGIRLMPRSLFVNTLMRRHRRATERDLPCVVGLLRLPPRPDGGGEDPQGLRHALLEAAARGVREQLNDPSVPICEWSDDALAFAVDGVGLRRAQAIGQELEQWLGSPAGIPAWPADAWRARVVLFDLNGSESFDAALLGLRARE